MSRSTVPHSRPGCGAAPAWLSASCPSATRTAPIRNSGSICASRRRMRAAIARASLTTSCSDFEKSVSLAGKLAARLAACSARLFSASRSSAVAHRRLRPALPGSLFPSGFEARVVSSAADCTRMPRRYSHIRVANSPARLSLVPVQSGCAPISQIFPEHGRRIGARRILEDFNA